MAEKWRASISEIGDGFVLCLGFFDTADDKGQHSFLTPRLLRSEVTWQQEPQIGDTIIANEDGTYTHVAAAP